MKNRILKHPLGIKLYEKYAKELPIIDYHNHLCVQDILSDRVFENITQLWIAVDPYKHRAMRILGIPEHYITGEASDLEKFEKWYGCLPRLAGNPLYDWSCMEFSTVFGISLEPFDRNPSAVYEEVNEKLRGMSAKSILAKFHVEYSAPCAALTDDVSVFNVLKGIAPSLRGDSIVAPNPEQIGLLSKLTGVPVTNLASYERAVESRLQAFLKVGCKFADHALDDGFTYVSEDGENEARFARIMRAEPLSEADSVALQSHLLKMLGTLYARNSMVLQLHIGAKRHTSTRLRLVAGPAGGYAAIGSNLDVGSLTHLLDDIEKVGGLPKTILFTLNPADNAVMSILSGSYSADGVEAVVSQGPAWWWCDHAQGMREMLEHNSVYSVLSAFIGMTTDSRSLLSFVRHDYFRKILCQWLAEKAEQGYFPENEAVLGDLINRVCYQNARNILG